MKTDRFEDANRPPLAPMRPAWQSTHGPSRLRIPVSWALVLLLMAAPAVARAQFKCTTNNGAVTITGYTVAQGAVAIPSSFGTNPVVSIGLEAFLDCSTMTSLTIPDSVTNIGVGAFEHCNSLTNVSLPSGPLAIQQAAFENCFELGTLTLPDTITSIANNAFLGCGRLTNVLIPNSVTSIGQNAFASCTSLASLTIPDSVTSIGSGAFGGTGLGSIAIPASVTNIGNGGFGACLSLTNISFQGNAPACNGAFYNDPNAIIYPLPGTTGWSGTVGDAPVWGFIALKLTTNASALTISGYAGAGGGLVIPPATNGLPVTSIGDWAFDNFAGLTNVVIPASVTNIGTGAFADCARLAAAGILEGVLSIGEDAFMGCSALPSVGIPANVTSIGTYAFGSCYGLAAIDVDTNNPAFSCIDGVLFDKSQATLLQYPCARVADPYIIPNSVNTIAPSAFLWSTNPVAVTIPNSVTTIGAAAFMGAFLTNVAIPASVALIGDNAFAECSSLLALSVDPSNPSYSSTDGVLFDKAQRLLIQYPCGRPGSYAVPTSVTTIGEEAFMGASFLANVTIGTGVTNIGDYTFAFCSLTNVTIPSSVVALGGSAFCESEGLQAVYFQGDAPALGDGDVFLGDVHATAFYLPGTTNWTSPFGGTWGIPAVVWNPSAQTGNATAGPGTNGFGFTITGTANIPIVIEASADLAGANWTPLQTCLLTNGSLYFSDPASTNYPARFYRFRSP